METKILKNSLENKYNELTFKEMGMLLDDFADAVVNLIETDNSSENVLRTLNYTKIRLYTLKSFVGKTEKKSFHIR